MNGPVPDRRARNAGAIALVSGGEKESSFPEEWNGHRFSDDERKMLLAGRKLLVEDMVSAKTGKEFSARLSWIYDEKWNEWKMKMTF